MALDFSENQVISFNNGVAATRYFAPPASDEIIAPIYNSGDVSGIELRMMQPYIRENGTSRIFPFPGYANIYCLTIVVSDVSNQLAGHIDLNGFQRIGDREYLPVNKTLFYWQSENGDDKAPNQIHTMCTLMKSKKGLRKAGEVIASVKSDNDYKDLISSLAGLATNAAQFSTVAGIMMQITGIVGKYLKDVEDKPIAAAVNSYTTLHGDFDRPGVIPSTSATRDADFHWKLVVRKKDVASQVAAGNEGFMPGVNVGAAVAEPIIMAAPALAEEVIVDMMPL
jgi:hypothetical protein